MARNKHAPGGVTRANGGMASRVIAAPAESTEPLAKAVLGFCRFGESGSGGRIHEYPQEESAAQSGVKRPTSSPSGCVFVGGSGEGTQPRLK